MSYRREHRRRDERAAFEAAVREHSLGIQLGVHDRAWFWARPKKAAVVHLWRHVDERGLQVGFVPVCGFAPGGTLVGTWRSEVGEALDPLAVLPRHVCARCRRAVVVGIARRMITR